MFGFKEDYFLYMDDCETLERIAEEVYSILEERNTNEIDEEELSEIAYNYGIKCLSDEDIKYIIERVES